MPVSAWIAKSCTPTSSVPCARLRPSRSSRVGFRPTRAASRRCIPAAGLTGRARARRSPRVDSMNAAAIAARRALRAVAGRVLTGSSTRGLAAVALFTVVQIADGVLTFQGVGRFGLQMESNPLLALSIAAIGAGLTLSIAKTIAVLLGTMLHRRQ